MLATIQKWGNSQGIRIPKNILDELQWSNQEELSLVAKNGKIIIERANKRKNIQELFANYKEEYTPENIEWGEPVGREIW